MTIRSGKKNLRNPYFKKSKLITWKWMGIFCALLALGSFILISVYTSPKFEITHITVQGLSDADREAVLQIAHPFIGMNRFRFDADALIAHIQKSFTFETLRVRRKEGTVEIVAEQKTAHVLWAVSDQRYLVDMHGAILRQAASDEPLDLPVFVDINDRKVYVGEFVLKETELVHTLQFLQELQNQNIGYSEVRFDRLAGKWVSVLTTLGYQILFDPLGDILAQSTHLQLVIRDTIPDISLLEYIDLRFGDHVYFK